MPELPEVETIRRDLDRSVRGLTIREIKINDRRVIRQDPGEFLRMVRGRKVLSVSRRGKALVFDLKECLLIVQPMMTGQMVVFPSGTEPVLLKEARVIFALSKNTALVYNDQRLFGRLQAIRSLNDHAHIRTMGPEPLEDGFTVGYLSAALAKRKIPVKPLLLDHRLVAGIGNIYASEALFRAGIRPDRKAGGLSADEVRSLWRAVRSVLTEAVKMRGTSVRNYRDGAGREGKYQKLIKVYGREGKSCGHCGAVVLKLVQSQRSTFFCGACQK
jgi:formamidopyrimidine-DNA glycosylase